MNAYFIYKIAKFALRERSSLSDSVRTAYSCCIENNMAWFKRIKLKNRHKFTRMALFVYNQHPGINLFA